ncbi:hypothetical protein TWF106_008511 [Orbilia oligospora]|uniref:Uncharacterized protein n=1 Tax=Orbilia oligospora TaxID=2813651 RepID=A0A6G1MHM3_ORBOL|nr:hypothetical protein TWF788_004223 [Orbilia oligospora]KAF3216337.1 hypothetical protein TWF106_008511 [Orbilia oligospora]KAF3221023.1 hypothetical protein TWF191_007231 [Orbilia oligospora]KAF3259011.1 hypothetical protein TWF192_011143 [Orbilia oligospora]
MDSTTSPILNILPVDVLSYLVEQIINDEDSLKSLSHTNRAFRLLSLPRLRSHTVILDISTGLRGQNGVLDPVFRTINDFNQEKNFRIPSHVRVLEIRDRWSAAHSRLHISQKSITEFVNALFTFLGKCISLRKLLRDGYEHEGFKTTDLIRKVLDLPKLKVLCLKIHQDRQWWFNETPKFEEYECASTLSKETGEKGLACLSVALPMSLDRSWWDEVWKLCRHIMISNIKTLKHLYFDGPDLEQIVKGMRANSLADIRLSTLRFRMGFDPTQFCAVLGLTELDDQNEDSEIRSDAVTPLRRLEFEFLENSGSFINDNAAVEIFRYFRTPNIKRSQIFGPSTVYSYTNGVMEPFGNPLLTHLSTYQALQFVELQGSSSKTWIENMLDTLARYHGESLNTIMLNQISIDFLYTSGRDLGPIDKFSSLRRLEILHRKTSFFWSIDSLWKIIKIRNTISEVQITMLRSPSGISSRLFRPSIGNHSSFPRRILTPIYSTAFYLHNRRNKIDISHYTSQDGELFASTKVITSYRQMLGDSSTDRLYISSYLRHMLHTKRLPSEQLFFPEPKDQAFGPELQNEAEAFSTFVCGIPDCLRLFQLEYVDKTGAEPGEVAKRDGGDVWKKIGGEWVYEKGLIELLPW